MLTLEELRLERPGFALKADWQAEPGERIAIIGPSGAGKSTLLDLIAGFEKPAAGRILWQERDITHAMPGERPVAILFQDNNLFPHLSLSQNLALALRPKGGRLSGAEQHQIGASLARVGLEGLAHRKPGSLSGGQQSRAALARVLVQRQPLLLLDEPFAALGPALKSEMLSLVEGLAAEMGALVFLVTHDPNDAQSFATRTVLVADGVAHAPAQTQALFADPPPALEQYLGS